MEDIVNGVGRAIETRQRSRRSVREEVWHVGQVFCSIGGRVSAEANTQTTGGAEYCISSTYFFSDHLFSCHFL